MNNNICPYICLYKRTSCQSLNQCRVTEADLPAAASLQALRDACLSGVSFSQALSRPLLTPDGGSACTLPSGHTAQPARGSFIRQMHSLSGGAGCISLSFVSSGVSFCLSLSVQVKAKIRIRRWLLRVSRQGHEHSVVSTCEILNKSHDMPGKAGGSQNQAALLGMCPPPETRGFLSLMGVLSNTHLPPSPTCGQFETRGLLRNVARPLGVPGKTFPGRQLRFSGPTRSLPGSSHAGSQPEAGSGRVHTLAAGEKSSLRREVQAPASALPSAR